MKNCISCNKEIKDYLNYCSTECHIHDVKKSGGKLYTPNNLPVTCVRYDGLMLECEHGDHEDYKFPVEVEWFDESYGEYGKLVKELHALIYNDDTVALTLNECVYYLWRLNNGENIYNPFKMGDMCLTQKSLEDIRNGMVKRT